MACRFGGYGSLAPATHSGRTRAQSAEARRGGFDAGNLSGRATTQIGGSARRSWRRSRRCRRHAGAVGPRGRRRWRSSTRAHTHTHKHTRVNTHRHTHTHKHTLLHTRAMSLPSAHIREHTRTHTHKHTQAHSPSHPCNASSLGKSSRCRFKRIVSGGSSQSYLISPSKARGPVSGPPRPHRVKPGRGCLGATLLGTS